MGAADSRLRGPAAAADQWRTAAGQQSQVWSSPRQARVAAAIEPRKSAVAVAKAVMSAGSGEPSQGSGQADMKLLWEKKGERYTSVSGSGVHKPERELSSPTSVDPTPARLHVTVFLPEVQGLSDVCVVLHPDRVLVHRSAERGPGEQLAEVPLSHTIAEDEAAVRFSVARRVLMVEAPVHLADSDVFAVPPPLSTVDAAAAAAVTRCVLSSESIAGVRSTSPWYRRAQLLFSAPLRTADDLGRWREVEQSCRQGFAEAALHVTTQAIDTAEAGGDAGDLRRIDTKTPGVHACVRLEDSLLCVWVMRGKGHRGLRAVLREARYVATAIRTDPVEPLPMNAPPSCLVSYRGRVCLVVARPPCATLTRVAPEQCKAAAACRVAVQEQFLLSSPPPLEFAAGSDGRLYLLPGETAGGLWSGRLRAELASALSAPVPASKDIADIVPGGSEAILQVQKRIRQQAATLMSDVGSSGLSELYDWSRPADKLERRAPPSKLTALMHAYGLSVCHLGSIALRSEADSALRTECMVEILARSVRDVWVDQSAHQEPQDAIASAAKLFDTAASVVAVSSRRGSSAAMAEQLMRSVERRTQEPVHSTLSAEQTRALVLRCWELCGIARDGEGSDAPRRFVATELSTALPVCDAASVWCSESGGKALAAHLVLRGALRCRLRRRNVGLRYSCPLLRACGHAVAMRLGVGSTQLRDAQHDLSVARRATPALPLQAARDPYRPAADIVSDAAEVAPEHTQPHNRVVAAGALVAAAAAPSVDGTSVALLAGAAIAHAREAAAALPRREQMAPLESLCGAAAVITHACRRSGDASPADVSSALSLCEEAAGWADSAAAERPGEPLGEDDTLGPALEETAQAAAELGEHMLDSSRPAEGERALRTSLVLYNHSMAPTGRRSSVCSDIPSPIQRTVMPLAMLDVATAKNNLGYAVHIQGPHREVEAMQLFREAMAAYEALPRKQVAAEFASALNNFASVLYSRNTHAALAESRQLYAKSLDMLTEELGEGHPDTELTKRNLDILVRRQDKRERAAVKIQKAWRSTGTPGCTRSQTKERRAVARDRSTLARDLRREEVLAWKSVVDAAASGAAAAEGSAQQAVLVVNLCSQESVQRSVTVFEEGASRQQLECRSASARQLEEEESAAREPLQQQRSRELKVLADDQQVSKEDTARRVQMRWGMQSVIGDEKRGRISIDEAERMSFSKSMSTLRTSWRKTKVDQEKRVRRESAEQRDVFEQAEAAARTRTEREESTVRDHAAAEEAEEKAAADASAAKRQRHEFVRVVVAAATAGAVIVVPVGRLLANSRRRTERLLREQKEAEERAKQERQRGAIERAEQRLGEWEEKLVEEDAAQGKTEGEQAAESEEPRPEPERPEPEQPEQQQHEQQPEEQQQQQSEEQQQQQSEEQQQQSEEQQPEAEQQQQPEEQQQPEAEQQQQQQQPEEQQQQQQQSEEQPQQSEPQPDDPPRQEEAAVQQSTPQTAPAPIPPPPPARPERPRLPGSEAASLGAAELHARRALELREGEHRSEMPKSPQVLMALVRLVREEKRSRRGVSDWRDCEIAARGKDVMRLTRRAAAEQARAAGCESVLLEEARQRRSTRGTEHEQRMELYEAEPQARLKAMQKAARMDTERREYKRRRVPPPSMLPATECAEAEARAQEVAREQVWRQQLLWLDWNGRAQIDVAAGTHTAKLRRKQSLAKLPPPFGTNTVDASGHEDTPLRSLARKHRTLLEALDHAAMTQPTGSPELRLGPAATHHPRAAASPPRVRAIEAAPAPPPVPATLPPVRPPPSRGSAVSAR